MESRKVEGSGLAIAVLLVILSGTLYLGWSGIHRGLWLDEAWVANSVRAGSLTGMFWDPDWMQTSPPLFLLTARAIVGVAGLSTESFRAIPLLFYLAAIVAMWLAGRRILSPPFALLGASLLAFHPNAVEYFLSFKQYGGEVVASGLLLLATFRYLEDPTRRRFTWLLAAIAGLALLAYPIAFLAPGVVVAVAIQDRHQTQSGTFRTGVLAGVVAATFGVLYLFFIRPNTEPVLYEFWKHDETPFWNSVSVIVALLAILSAVRLTRRAVTRRFTTADSMEFVLLAPIPLLAIAEGLGWYPGSVRTHLFLRPLVILLGLLYLERVAAWLGARFNFSPKRLAPIGLLAALLFMGWQVARQRNRSAPPDEDYSAAITWFQEHARPGDTLLAHASTQPGLDLYSAIRGWDPNRELNLKLGNTGWPCCPRGIDALPGSSSAPALRDDLLRLLGPKPSGRIYNFYTDRFLHWQYTGLDEGLFTTKWLEAHGCQASPPIKLPSLDIQPLDCGDPVTVQGNRPDSP